LLLIIFNVEDAINEFEESALLLQLSTAQKKSFNSWTSFPNTISLTTLKVEVNKIECPVVRGEVNEIVNIAD